MSFDFRYLRYAIAAADHGSFRRAAEALALKQSTLSRRIRQMEQNVGAQLFERTRIGVRPTPAGADFLRSARRIIQQAESMRVSASAAGRGEAGRLTIGFYTSLSAGNLRATLAEYIRHFPNIDVCLYQSSRAELFAAVDSAAVDIAIVTGEPNTMHGRSMALWSERIMVALSDRHALAVQERLSWPDLKRETFLLARFDLGQDFRDLLMMKLSTPGDRPKIVQYEVNGETIKSLVGAGWGISITCDACLGVNYVGVVYREVRDGNGACRIGYCAHWAHDNANPALAAFLKLLHERYPTPPEIE